MKELLTTRGDGAPAPAVLATAESTGGLYGLATLTLPPHCPGDPLRSVAAGRQGCYVLAGTLALTVGTSTVTLDQGGSVLVPTGVAFSYWNPTAAPTVVLLIALPG
jgi:hypothetical protein